MWDHSCKAPSSAISVAMTSVASAVPVSSGGVEVGSAASASAPPAGAQTAPAAASSGPSGPSTRSLVLDLGGDTLKVGWAGSSAPNRIIPNCAVKNKRDTKWLVGDQFLPEEVRRPTPNNHPGIPGKMAPTTQIVHKITDYSGLYVRRPHERVRRQRRHTQAAGERWIRGTQQGASPLLSHHCCFSLCTLHLLRVSS